MKVALIMFCVLAIVIVVSVARVSSICSRLEEKEKEDGK